MQKERKVSCLKNGQPVNSCFGGTDLLRSLSLDGVRYWLGKGLSIQAVLRGEGVHQ